MNKQDLGHIDVDKSDDEITEAFRRTSESLKMPNMGKAGDC